MDSKKNKNLKILVVDDNKDSNYLLEVMLKQRGYVVDTAFNGLEAIKKINKDGIGIVISDILMPVMDGFELCKKVKDDPRLKDVIFIFYSAEYVSKTDEEFALSLGAERFIKKPIKPDNFLLIIDEVVRDYEAGKLIMSEKHIEKENVFIKKHKEKIAKKLEEKIAITERINKALKESESKYRNLVELARDGIVIIQDGNIEYVNPYLLERFGYRKDVVRGFPFLSFVASGQKKKLKTYYKDRMSGKKVPSLYETKLLDNNGTEVYVECSVRVIDYRGKKADLVIIRDLSERKESEKRIKKHMNEIAAERDKLDTIIQSIGDAVFVIDKNYKILLLNRVASFISGYSISEAIGRKYDEVFKFVLEKNQEMNMGFIKKAIEKGRTQKMKNHTLLITKKNKKIAITDSAAPLKDEEGKVVGCVVVFHDVTHERKVEKMKTEFVSIASHQLKTPLTGIKWFTELLLKEKAGEINDKQKDFLTQISLSNDRMIKLVKDLLEVSHIETGKKFDIKKTESDILEIIEQAIMDNQSLIREKKIMIKNKIKEASRDKFLFDREKIRQVFYNLISNACKYCGENGIIEIGCDCEVERGMFRKKCGCDFDRDKQIAFYVKDNGMGIPKKQQEKVFEKFFRADNAVIAQADGTGLGLYIAKAIVEAHGGHIWFESEEGKGTVFHFSLLK